MSDDVLERLERLDAAVRGAAEALGRLREENLALKRDLQRVGEERRHVVTQIDAVLRDLTKLVPDA